MVWLGCENSADIERSLDMEEFPGASALHVQGMPEEIAVKMWRQSNAWNAGDLPEFMAAGYLQSDSLLFIGNNGVTSGYDATLSNYLRSYPNVAAMGTLDFKNLHWTSCGKSHGFVIGQWSLARQDSLADLGGHYSLLWEWTVEAGWVIVADHSS